MRTKTFSIFRKYIVYENYREIFFKNKQILDDCN